MKVLMITGDKNVFVPGTNAHRRLVLQRTQVEVLEPLYWGPGAPWPKVPDGRFDIVTVQDPFWRGLFTLWVARRMGAKLNVQVHTDLSAQQFFRRVLAHIVLGHADSVRVVSEKIKKQLENMRVRAPIYVLPVFVDIERFKKIVSVPHAKKTILWVGRFEDEKDPMAALSIFRTVRDLGLDAKLIMVGAGSLAEELKEKAKTAGFTIQFPGWQDPAAYLVSADVVVCTSKHESYGVSIIEALAAGVLVVAPDVGVAREAGALVVSRSDLARAVVDVLRGNMRGMLKLQLPSDSEWAKQWRETLI